MLCYAVAVLSSYLAVVSSRETIRPMPTITNSLVNLGKMEISFYFNGNGRDSPSHQPERLRSNMPYSPPKPELLPEEQCPCSSLRSMKDSFLTNPTSILNKLLMNNDLFSFKNDPIASALCCESHEHVQEGTVVFEFPANGKGGNPGNTRSGLVPLPSVGNYGPSSNKGMPMPVMPFLFESMIPNKSMLPLKTKSIEIFLIPKKKEFGAEMPKLPQKKKESPKVLGQNIDLEDIQIVGDRKPKNNISIFKPVSPVVKKDLNLQVKYDNAHKKNENQNEKKKEDEQIKKGDIDKAENNGILIEPANKPNTV